MFHRALKTSHSLRTLLTMNMATVPYRFFKALGAKEAVKKSQEWKKKTIALKAMLEEGGRLNGELKSRPSMRSQQLKFALEDQENVRNEATKEKRRAQELEAQLEEETRRRKLSVRRS
ncbi:hypothetical protein QR680_019035 [Steinernema hermaphroditum]|uniref:Uncharacterized protein n=1 Tax=Steinernema hermaphroditum TaxID=289476 RepID=A0AA39LRY5_9BILA|nr:hypothetical protein QR680_019035 [Steinernema hermaphroditum]